MSLGPAPLELIREKLASPNAETRFVALVHAAAHGAAAASLAARVVGLLEDERAGLPQQTLGTLRAIAWDAADAVAPLLALLDAASEALSRRAIIGLGCVGPAAVPAVPHLKSRLRQDADDSATLEALLAIAPGDADVLDAIVRGAFSSNFSVQQLSERALEHGDERTLDRLIAEVTTRAQTPVSMPPTPPSLRVIAARRPQHASELLLALLGSANPEAVKAAAVALPALAPPWPSALVDAARSAAAREGPGQSYASSALAALDAASGPRQGNPLQAIESERAARRGPHAEPGAAQALPAFPDPEQEVTPALRALTKSELRELQQLTREGLRKLGFKRGEVPSARSVIEATERWRQQNQADLDPTANPYLVGISLAFGDAIVRARGWSWSVCAWLGVSDPALVSPDAGCVLLPTSYVARPDSQLLALLDDASAAGRSGVPAGALRILG